MGRKFYINHNNNTDINHKPRLNEKIKQSQFYVEIL